MPNDLKMRTTAPEGYVPTSTLAPIVGQAALPSNIPEPPSEGYTPNPAFRSPLPALLTTPDSQRQIFQRGINGRRFWPFSNGNQ